MRFFKTLILSVLCICTSSNTVFADDIAMLSKPLDILRNQDQQIYYPGNGMALSYFLPSQLQDVLSKTTPYIVLHSPLGEPIALATIISQ